LANFIEYIDGNLVCGGADYFSTSTKPFVSDKFQFVGVEFDQLITPERVSEDVVSNETMKFLVSAQVCRIRLRGLMAIRPGDKYVDGRTATVT